MKRVTLCADDYALNDAVSRGILQLAEAGRLSAISCMSVSRHWPEHARWLEPLRGRVDIGLHLTLTELAPLGPMPRFVPSKQFPPLGKVLGDGLLHRLPVAEIAAELERQMECFIEQTGHAPDFIDGHQHIHLLPGVRETVLALWQHHMRSTDGYLRSCHEPLGAILKRGVEPAKAIIISTLSRRLTRMAKQRGIPINDSFRGVHDFSGRVLPQQLFPHFLQGTGQRPLIMCHPGLLGSSNDVLRDWRPQEQSYFASELFVEDMEEAGVVLGRLVGQS